MISLSCYLIDVLLKNEHCVKPKNNRFKSVWQNAIVFEQETWNQKKSKLIVEIKWIT